MSTGPWNMTTAWGLLVSLAVLAVIGGGAEPTSTPQKPDSGTSGVETNLQPSQTLLPSSTTPVLNTSSTTSPDDTNSALTNQTIPLASDTSALTDDSSSSSQLTSLSLVSPTDAMTSLNLPTSSPTALTPSRTVPLLTHPTATSSVNATDSSDSVSDAYGLSASPGPDIVTALSITSPSGSTDAASTTVSIQPTQVSPTVVPNSTGMSMPSSDIPYQVSTASMATGNSSDGPHHKLTTDASSHVEDHKHSSLSVGAKAAIGVFVSLGVCGVIFGAIVCSRRSNVTARSVKSFITSGIRYKTYKNKDDEGMLIMPDRR
ncbi:unnamed protein product [Lymnaea stagnalis]|uniref:Uncharacterized protein n=1 Tax=Lymnaea stagnalis TaxID=6523 RepID=A0AAV2HAF0_LYMST